MTHDYVGNGGPSGNDSQMGPDVVDHLRYRDETTSARLSEPLRVCGRVTPPGSLEGMSRTV
jgi:hypothetical protein